MQAFKDHKAKCIPETVPATLILATMNLSLVSNLATPIPNPTSPLLVPSHCHHPPPPWYNSSSHPSCANYHAYSAYHPQPSWHSCQPQPAHHNYRPYPLVMNAWSYPQTGPPPQPIGQSDQNSTAIDDFCMTHGLDGAASDSLKKLMSGAPQWV